MAKKKAKPKYVWGYRLSRLVFGDGNDSVIVFNDIETASKRLPSHVGTVLYELVPVKRFRVKP